MYIYGNPLIFFKCIKKQTSLLLNQNVNINTFDIKPSYQSTSCDVTKVKKISNNLEKMKPSLSDEILVYIAEYIT